MLEPCLASTSSLVLVLDFFSLLPNCSCVVSGSKLQINLHLKLELCMCGANNLTARDGWRMTNFSGGPTLMEYSKQNRSPLSNNMNAVPPIGRAPNCLGGFLMWICADPTIGM